MGRGEEQQQQAQKTTNNNKNTTKGNTEINYNHCELQNDTFITRSQQRDNIINDNTSIFDKIAAMNTNSNNGKRRINRYNDIRQ